MIDWRLIGAPVDLTGGLSVLGGGLRDLRMEAESRRRWEAERQLQRDQMAAQQAHWGAQQAHQDAQLAWQKQKAQADAEADAARLAHERDRAFGPILPKVTEQLEAQNPQAAQAIAAPWGAAVNERPIETQRPESDDEYGRRMAPGLMGLGTLGVLSPFSSPFGPGLEELARPSRQAVKEAKPGYEIRMPSGGAQQFDAAGSRAARDAEAERNVEALPNLFTGLPPLYQLRAKSAAEARARAGASRDEAAKEGLAAATWAEGQDNAMKRAYAAKTERPMSAGERGRMERGILGDLRQDITAWQQDTGYDQVAKEFRDAKVALAQLRSGNPVEQTAARFSMGRAIAGPGVFTEGEQKQILGRVGGEFQRWEQLVQTWVDGKLTPGQKKIFEDAIEGRVRDIQQRRAVELSNNYKQSFMSEGSGFEGQRRNVINRYNRLFAPFGMKMQVEGEGISLTPNGKPPPQKAPEPSDGDRLKRMGF